MASNSNKPTGLETYIRVFKENWLFLLIAVAVLFNYKKILGFFKSFSVASVNEAYQEATVTVKTTGGGTQRVNVAPIANGIYNAFYNYFKGMMEDEATAINYVKQCPKSAIPALADAYSRIGDTPHSLYEDFQKYLSVKDYNAVKSFLY